jgi:hypothetical protein
MFLQLLVRFEPKSVKKEDLVTATSLLYVIQNNCIPLEIHYKIFRLLVVTSHGRTAQSIAMLFGLAFQGKDIAFRFIIEDSSLRDFGP